MAQFYSAKRRTTTRQIITVSVNDLDSFGQGVARHNGKALFIPGLLPQENAEVTVTEDKKQYARAKVVRRLSDSPERETPRCPGSDSNLLIVFYVQIMPDDLVMQLHR
ncbi:TRAM domain-containing protein, partial [Escherichia coli]